LSTTVVLADDSGRAKVLVKAAPGGPLSSALGIGFGVVRPLDDGVLGIGSGVGEWLLLGPPGPADGLAERWRAESDDGLVTVLDATAGRTVLRLTGAAGGAVLAKVCGVDMASAADGTAVRTSVARVASLVVRTGDDFLLSCERSFGEYLADALLDAGAEFGIVQEPAR
jgi:sarcosine oxidase subunit gamma